VSRPLRADARRNRAALLAAAEEVFASRGVSASTEEVARAAGVGIGTLFRHFPTKEALLEAVFQARMGQLAEQAEALGDAGDPGAAFFDFFRAVVENSGRKTAVTDALIEAGVDVHSSVAAERGRLSQALGVLLTRAQQARAVRPDVTLHDLFSLLVGASRAVEHAADAATRARLVTIMLDGLRPH
jgi:AcrR family transcriptional regulator